MAIVMDKQTQKIRDWFVKVLKNANLDPNTSLKGIFTLTNPSDGNQRDPFNSPSLAKFTVDDFQKMDFEEIYDDWEDHFDENDLLATAVIAWSNLEDGYKLTLSNGFEVKLDGSVAAPVKDEPKKEEPKKEEPKKEAKKESKKESKKAKEEEQEELDESFDDSIDEDAEAREAEEQELQTYREFAEKLSMILGTYLEMEAEGHNILPADLTNPKVLNRFQSKNENGEYVSHFSEESMARLTGSNEKARLQELNELCKDIQNGNIFLREVDGSLYEMKMSQSGAPYRGEMTQGADLKEGEKPLFNVVESEAPFGAVTMFFMRLFQMLGADWYDNEIAQQDAYEAQMKLDSFRSPEERANLRAERYAAALADQKLEEAAFDLKPLYKEAGLSRDWDFPQNVFLAASIHGSPYQARCFTNFSKGLDTKMENMSAFAAIMGQPLETPEDEILAQQFMDAILRQDRTLWERTPEMKAFIQKGLDRYEAARAELNGTKVADEIDVPMAKLISNSINRMADYTNNLNQLDQRVLALGDITTRLCTYANRYSSLKNALTGVTPLNARGIIELAKLTEEGLHARADLASRKIPASEINSAMGDYLAFESVNKAIIIRSNMRDLLEDQPDQLSAAQTAKLNTPAARALLSANLVAGMGGLGRETLQVQFQNSGFVQEKMANLNNAQKEVVGRKLALDSYVNGDKSEFGKISAKNASVLGRALVKLQPTAEETAIVPRNAAAPERSSGRLLPEPPKSSGPVPGMGG